MAGGVLSVNKQILRRKVESSERNYYKSFTWKNIFDMIMKLNGRAIENPWNKKLRKTKLYLKYNLHEMFE